MMKKLIAVLMIVAMMLSFASCGAINGDKEVSVLWSDMGDEYVATISDALDRAMYIENINYADYDAAGNAATQIAQADEAIANGAVALIVNATDIATASVIFKKAKDADLPIVFLCNDFDLPASLIDSYAKCAIVNVDRVSVVDVLGEKIAKDLVEKYEDYDRNGDGKISYAAFGSAALFVPSINEALQDADKPALKDTLYVACPTTGIETVVDRIFDGYDGSGNEVNETPVELILTDNDDYVDELLLAMRKYELNYKKLVTHFIPLYTVGIAANAGSLIDSKNEEELAAYSVMSAIDKGYLSAGALENDDEIALSAAAIVRNFIKGNEMLSGVNESYINGIEVLVPYTVYE